MSSKPLSLTSPNQRQGARFEQLALEYLQSHGLRLIAQNWLAPNYGELDLVMMAPGRGWDVLLFVEVRQRRQQNFGDALMSITPAKQRKIIAAARCFLSQHPEYAQYECRFDVVAFSDEHSPPDWVVGAFMAQAWS